MIRRLLDALLRPLRTTDSIDYQVHAPLGTITALIAREQAVTERRSHVSAAGQSFQATSTYLTQNALTFLRTHLKSQLLLPEAERSEPLRRWLTDAGNARAAARFLLGHDLHQVHSVTMAGEGHSPLRQVFNDRDGIEQFGEVIRSGWRIDFERGGQFTARPAHRGPTVFLPISPYEGTVVNWTGGHYNVRADKADQHGCRGVRQCEVHELRPVPPAVDDVVDARHAVYVSGALRHKGISYRHVCKIVKNLRFKRVPFHQDPDDRAIVVENRRYVPITPEMPQAAGAPFEFSQEAAADANRLVAAEAALAKLGTADEFVHCVNAGGPTDVATFSRGVTLEIVAAEIRRGAQVREAGSSLLIHRRECRTRVFNQQGSTARDVND